MHNKADYTISTETWSWEQVSFASDNRPPILIDPTVTIVSQQSNSTQMFVFGGYMATNHSMSRSIYVYDVGKCKVSRSGKGKKSNIDCNSYWILEKSIEEKQYWLCGSSRDLPSRHRVDLLFWWSTRKQKQCHIRVSHSERSLVPGSATVKVSGTNTRSSCAISKRPSIVIRRTNTKRRR